MTRKTRLYASKSGNLTVRFPEHQTVRFWTHYKGSWVKLTLDEGQEICIGFRESDDEGFSYQSDHFRISGNQVVNEWSQGGRDCDGRIDNEGCCYCLIEKLAVLPAWKDQTILLPDWQHTTSMIVHDEYAEAANY